MRAPSHNRVFHLVRLLARRPADVRYSLDYVRSLADYRSPLADATPWMPFRAIDWLARNAAGDWSAFEYGSGGTTLFLAKRVRALHSIEHDPSWFEQSAAALGSVGVDHVRYELIEPERRIGGQESAEAFGSTDAAYCGQSFKRYVRAIDVHADNSLDLVVVDGRARVACVGRALPKLRDGGYLLLDNSDRAEYAPAFARLRHLPRLDLAGLTPYSYDLAQSTIWRAET